MKLPRDLSGDELVSALQRVGYSVVRQTGSHVRLVTQERGEHYATVPRHSPLRIGTLAGILGDVAEHLGLSRDELINRLLR
jgi:predicted RNA binding protein YcfA (HicA-like mRNA interferase family)